MSAVFILFPKATLNVMLCLGDDATLYPLPKYRVPGTISIDLDTIANDNNKNDDLIIDFSKKDIIDNIVTLVHLEVISGNDVVETYIQQIDENNIIVSNMEITSSASVSDYPVKNILHDTNIWKSNSHTGNILFDFSSNKTINKVEILNDLTNGFTGFSKIFIYSTDDKNELPTNYTFGENTYPTGSGSNYTTVYENIGGIKKHIYISNIDVHTQFIQFWFQTNDINNLMSVNQIKIHTYNTTSSSENTFQNHLVNSSLFPGNFALQLNNSSPNTILQIKSMDTSLTNFSFFAWYNLNQLNEQILFQSNSRKLTVNNNGSLALHI